MPATDATGKGPSTDDRDWNEIRACLGEQFGQGPYETWFRRLRFEGIDSGTAMLSIEGPAPRSYVEARYGRDILKQWSARRTDVRRIRIMEAKAPAGEAPDARPQHAPAVARPQAREQLHPASLKPTLKGALDPRLTFETLVVGDPNLLATNAARQIAAGMRENMNPLFLYGQPGCGKTHTLVAIAHEARRLDPSLNILYVPVEHFSGRYSDAAYRLKSARNYDVMAELKERVRSADLLLLDDFHLLQGRERTQAEIFETIREVVGTGGRVVVAADRPPLDLEGIEKNFRGRLSSGLVLEVESADYPLRLEIVRQRARERAELDGISVPEDVLEFLASRITASVRELEGALNTVIFYAKGFQREVTMHTAEHALADMLRAKDRRITVDMIIRTVADYYNMPVADILSESRRRSIVRPRHAAMYLAKKLTRRSLTDLGMRFGGKDHTSIIYAVGKIEERMVSEPDLVDDIEILTRRLTD